MIPFASWSLATTRDILPSGSGVAEGRYRTKVAPEAGRYAPEETDEFVGLTNGVASGLRERKSAINYLSRSSEARADHLPATL
jgi:hypothetical protein